MSNNDSYDTDDCLVDETTGLLDNPLMSGERRNDNRPSQGSTNANSTMENDSVSILLESEPSAYLGRMIIQPMLVYKNHFVITYCILQYRYISLS